MKRVQGVPTTELYTACHIADYGITPTDFEENPESVLAKIGQSDAPATINRGFKPLLPAQAKLRMRLDAQVEANRAATQPHDILSRRHLRVVQ